MHRRQLKNDRYSINMNTPRAPTLLMLGMQTTFSLQVLTRLIAVGIKPRAIVVHQENSRGRNRSREIPVALAGSFEGIALNAEVPLIRTASLADLDVFEQAQRVEPDVLLVACFPDRLPPRWLKLAKSVSVNLHPSLLPKYRGPAPLFWHFRHGETETGVTLHLMDGQLDAGDIISQSKIALSHEADYDSVAREQARLGADAVRDMLNELTAGRPVHSRPQVESEATYYPFPTETDLRLDKSMKAAEAYHFMRAVQQWFGPFTALVGSQVVTLERATGFETGPAPRTGARLGENEIRLSCKDGMLIARRRVSRHEP